MQILIKANCILKVYLILDSLECLDDYGYLCTISNIILIKLKL